MSKQEVARFANDLFSLCDNFKEGVKNIYIDANYKRKVAIVVESDGSCMSYLAVLGQGYDDHPVECSRSEITGKENCEMVNDLLDKIGKYPDFTSVSLDDIVITYREGNKSIDLATSTQPGLKELMDELIQIEGVFDYREYHFTIDDIITRIDSSLKENNGKVTKKLIQELDDMRPRESDLYSFPDPDFIPESGLSLQDLLNLDINTFSRGHLRHLIYTLYLPGFYSAEILDRVNLIAVKRSLKFWKYKYPEDSSMEMAIHIKTEYMNQNSTLSQLVNANEEAKKIKEVKQRLRFSSESEWIKQTSSAMLAGESIIYATYGEIPPLPNVVVTYAMAYGTFWEYRIYSAVKKNPQKFKKQIEASKMEYVNIDKLSEYDMLTTLARHIGEEEGKRVEICALKMMIRLIFSNINRS